MTFEAFVSRILLIKERQNVRKAKCKQRKQNRWQVINGKMMITSINKSLFT